MGKRVLAGLLLAVLLAVAVSGEQLSKIGIVVFSKVVENFPSGSPAFSKLQNLKETFETQRQDYLAELNRKELELLELKDGGNQIQIANLEREIETFKVFINDWQGIKLKQLEIAQEEFLQGEDIATDIYKAIEFIAINEGYTLILDESDQNIIWYSPEIDITDLVINRLRVLAR